MPTALDETIADAEQLPAANQDDLARHIQEELAEDRFDALIASRPDALEKLMEMAKADIAAGRVWPLAPDEL